METLYYVPEYSTSTSIKSGEYPKPQDIMARSMLIREFRGDCLSEVWVPQKGYVPVYHFPRPLTQDECDVLCLTPYDMD